MPTQRDLLEIIPYPPGGGLSSASYGRQREMPLLEAGTSTPETTKPVISNVLPSPGTTLAPTTPISFDVTDDKGAFVRIMVTAKFPRAGVWHLVHDGDHYAPNYDGERNVITNGFHYYNVRPKLGGWAEAPQLLVDAIDLAGNEND
jgi:hypothetical protein